jgi:hypothetical protein
MFGQKVFSNIAGNRGSADQTGSVIFWIFYHIGCHKLLQTAFEFIIPNHMVHQVFSLVVQIPAGLPANQTAVAPFLCAARH